MQLERRVVLKVCALRDENRASSVSRRVFEIVYGSAGIHFCRKMKMLLIFDNLFFLDFSCLMIGDV